MIPKTIIIVLLLAITNLLGKSHNNIKIFTEQYPPYNMTIDGQLTGISVEVLDAMFKQMKSEQSLRNVKLTNWARGYTITQKFKNTMIFSTTRTKEREKLFKWVGPIAKATVGIIAPKMKNIKINKISDLNQYRIGAVLKDVGELLLLSSGVNKDAIHYVKGNDAISVSLQKMAKNKLDIIAYNVEVAFANGRSKGFDMSKYEVVYVLKKAELYFAFNNSTDDSIIHKWQKSLDDIKKDGSFDKILKRYAN